MKKKTNIWIAVVLVALSVFFLKIGFSKSDDSAKKKDKNKAQKKVEAFVVQPSNLSDEISVSGTLQAYNEVELKNEVAGRIVTLNLPEGKFVKKGTLLVKLFDDDLQAGLKKLRSQLALQQDIYNRQTQLFGVNGISKNDYEQTQLQVNTLKADIEVQKTLIRKTEVRAPFDGTIGLRSVSVGAVITPSSLLATIRTDNKLKLDFFVPEKYGPEVKPGMKIKFTLSEGDKQYDATVVATEQGVDNATHNLKIRAMVSSPSKELIAGSFATINLKLSERRNALMIPTQAIIPQEEEKKVIVARQGKAHFVNIKTGVRKFSKIEVTAGLKPGDTVITSGVLFLKEKSDLKYSTVSK